MRYKHILKTVLFLLTLVFPLFATAQSEKKDLRKIQKGKIADRQYFSKSGYMMHTGMDILPGDETTSIRFQLVNGYKFNPEFSAGLGIGFTYYDDPLSLLPLFLDLEYVFRRAGITPFIFLKSGYGFSILTDTETFVDSHRGGFMVNPGMGLKFETKHKFGWYFNAGYNLENAKFKRNIFGDRIVETEISYRRLMFGAGLSF